MRIKKTQNLILLSNLLDTLQKDKPLKKLKGLDGEFLYTNTSS
jgi:hypothetical protein